MSEKEWRIRLLTGGEISLGCKVFGGEIDYRRVRIFREKYVFFQPVDTTMAPDGDIWLHPKSALACGSAMEDFSKASLGIRAHFIHEMTHVWQYQHGIDPIAEKVCMFFRHGPRGGYHYTLVPGKIFTDYNIEQQACIIADIYLARCKGKPFELTPLGTPVV